jgi:hypothetical protein
MASSPRRRVVPELSRLCAPKTLNRACVSNAPGLVPPAPSTSMPSHHVSSARLPIGILLYLVSVGLVGAATVGLFFGSGFLLLARTKEQMRTEAGSHDRDTEIDPMRPTEPSARVENGALSSGGVPTLSSTASEATVIAFVQTAAPSSPAPRLRATSVPPSRGRGGDHLRKLSRPSHSRSDAMPGEARAAASRNRSGKQDHKQDPADYAAGSVNQQEYNQLHATGPAVDLSWAAPSR